MDFRQAIIKSMKAYYKGLTPDELRGVSEKEPKYDKKYFDKVGSENGIEAIDLKKGKYK